MAEVGFAYHPAPTTDADVRKRREKEGRCADCGAQTHAKSWTKKTPLTLPGEVHRGRCLRCHPLGSSGNADQKKQLEAAAAHAGGAATNAALTTRATNNANGISYYQIGDAVPLSVIGCAISAVAPRLKVGDAAFVQRSDGRWTYAILEEIQPGVLQSFVFHVDPSGVDASGGATVTTKVFLAPHVATCIRSVPHPTSHSYRIGDPVRSIDLNNAPAASAPNLNVHDAAFVQRSDGRWTYAVLDTINPCVEPSLVFATDKTQTNISATKKSTKSLAESAWASRVRCAPPPPAQATTASGPLKIGDVAPDEVGRSSLTETHVPASRLDVGDAAYVLRGDGRWTYAVVRRIDPGPSLVFQVEAGDPAGVRAALEKVFPEATWASSVRCLPPATATAAPSISYAPATKEYELGDIVASDDVRRSPAAVACRLSVGDTALVRRSDGRWNYAAVVRIDPGPPQCLVCRVGGDGASVAMKTLPDDAWASSVRCIPPTS